MANLGSLAQVLKVKVGLLVQKSQKTKAIIVQEEVVATIKSQLNQDGSPELARDLVRSILNLASFLTGEGRLQEAQGRVGQAMRILDNMTSADFDDGLEHERAVCSWLLNQIQEKQS